MSDRMVRIIFQGVLLACLGTSLVWAQVTAGTIAGMIRDESGAVIPAVQVVVRNADTGITRTVTTNEAGRYVVPNLIPGNYEVDAAHAGFQTTKRSEIVLTVGREVLVDLELRVGAATQTIQVVGEIPTVDTATSTISGLVSERSIRELPLNGRSFESLATLQLGVAAYDHMNRSAGRGRGTHMTVGGSRPIQNIFLIDGMNVVEHGGASPGSVAGVNLGVEAIREFQILTNSYPAEFGDNTGGIINAVTRSGSNTLHGSVYEYLRNSKLDAKNFFDLPEEPIPAFKRNQFGASVGGPIRKDRMFFFGNYEGLRERLGLTNIVIVPNAAARNGVLPDGPVTVNPAVRPYLNLYKLPNLGDIPGSGGGFYHFSPSSPTREDYMMGRVDYQFSDRDSFFGRYLFSDSDQLVPRDERMGVWADSTSARRMNASVGYDRVFSPSVMNVFRFGFNRHSDPQETLELVDIDPSLSFVQGDKLGEIIIGGDVGGGQRSAFAEFGSEGGRPRHYLQNKFQISDTVTYSTGPHAFKMGANILRIQDNSTIGSNRRGQFTFPSLRDLLEGRPDRFRAVGGGFGKNGYPPGWRQINFGFFVQDDYRVSQSLTLNLGLRWEFTTDPIEVNGKMSNVVNFDTDTQTTVGIAVSPMKKNFQPRLGFAWSPTASKKTALRGGFGLYHEATTPIVYANYVANLPPHHVQADFRNPGFPDPRVGGSVRVDPPGGSPREINFHQPSKMQYNLNLQHEILPATSFTVGYIGSQSRHLSASYEANYRLPIVLPDGSRRWPLDARGRPSGPFRNPRLGALLYGCRCSSSGYNGLVVGLNRVPQGMFGYQISYTWSKSMDVSSQVNSAEGLNGASALMDAFDFSLDRGVSNYNIGHVFVANYTLDIPTPELTGVAKALLGGWGMKGIFTATTGPPMYVRTGFSRSGSARSAGGGVDRPDLLPGFSNNPVEGVTAGCSGVPAGQKLGDPAQWYDPCAFALPPIETISGVRVGRMGNLGRNTVRGPGVVNFDLSLTKGFALSERYNLEFRSEFFNFFNTPRFGAPGLIMFDSTGVVSPGAGKITSTKGTSRQIQFALKLTF